ncbi:MAG: cation-transporting P-type ATPase, partial [Thiobacillus sp.]|nr:cation-transporting P-type ATPase [Thiobacillus sp.]
MSTTEPTPTKHWHAQSAEQVCADLETDPARGLPPDEAAQRLTRHGPNKLAEKKPRSAWLKFLDQFKNVLVIVLLGAAVLAGAIGDLKDAV